LELGTLKISYYRLWIVAARGKGAVLEVKYTVPHVLRHPTAIFEGLCDARDSDSRGFEWRCYCGVPPYRYWNDGQTRAVPDDRIFLVFVNTEMVAYNWRWEPVDDDHRDYPVRYQERFNRKIL
jgi:hypothetical protein